MLVLSNIHKSFNKGKNNEISVLKGISLSFANTGLYAILGPSGSGKSTLLSLIGGLDKPDTGTILFNNLDITRLSEKEMDLYHQNLVSFIFQDNNLIDYLSLKDNALLKSNKNNEEVLKKLDIYPLLKKKPCELSGGEKERCAIARALLSDSEILLCDEPTASLDSANAENVLSLLKEISKTKLVIVVSHDEELCKKTADHLIHIKDGIINDCPQETKTESDAPSFKKNKIYRSRLINKVFHHAKHNIKSTSLIVFLSTIAFLFVSMIIGLTTGAGESVTRAMNELIRSSPLTVSSYYENLSSLVFLKENSSPKYELGINIDQETDIITSLHKNIITQDFADYLTANPIGDTYFAFNNDQNYSLIYEDNGAYRLFDNQQNDSISDYVSSFLGKKSAINELIYEEDYFKKQYDWLGGAFPSNEHEAVLVYSKNNSITDEIATLLHLKEGEDPKNALGKTINFVDHQKIYAVNDSINVEGYYLKDYVTLKQEGQDLRAINNYFIKYVNGYYEGDVNEQKEAIASINALFKDEKENRTLNAYIKMQNSTFLKDLVANKETETVTITGIAIIKEDNFFQSRLNGIMIPQKTLKDIRYRNSQSDIAKEIDQHIVLKNKGSGVNLIAPSLYSFSNMISETNSGDIEDYLLNFINFFENRKFFSVNNEISSIEIYAPTVKIKNQYADKIEQYNNDKNLNYAYEIKCLDLTKQVINYFDLYFNIIRTVLFVITIATLVISCILSFAIIYNMVKARIYEIGILRTAGYRGSYIFALIEIESLSFGLISGALGLGIAHLVIPFIQNYLRSNIDTVSFQHVIHLTPFWSIMIMVLAVAASFVAAVVPSLVYSKKKPIDILKR